MTLPVPSLNAWGSRPGCGEGTGRGRRAVLALPPGLGQGSRTMVCPFLPTFPCRLSRLQPLLSLRGEASGDTLEVLRSHQEEAREPCPATSVLQGCGRAARGCSLLRPLTLSLNALPASMALPSSLRVCPHAGVCPHTGTVARPASPQPEARAWVSFCKNNRLHTEAYFWKRFLCSILSH